MSLSDLASIGSLVSGMAVLISLIYLALQVRQADKNQRALLTQGANTRATEFVAICLQPDIADLFYKMRGGNTEFTGRECIQIRMLLRIMITILEDIRIQFKAGLVDQSTLDAIVAGFRTTLAMPAMRAARKGSRTGHATEIGSLVDGLIESLPLSEPIDAVAELKANLAEVMH